MFSPQFLIRLFGVLITIIITGCLIVIIIYVINRTTRYTIDWIRKEAADQTTWLGSILPKFKKSRKKKV